MRQAMGRFAKYTHWSEPRGWAVTVNIPIAHHRGDIALSFLPKYHVVAMVLLSAGCVCARRYGSHEGFRVKAYVATVTHQCLLTSK